jgi:hypothetical protein
MKLASVTVTAILAGSVLVSACSSSGSYSSSSSSTASTSSSTGSTDSSRLTVEKVQRAVDKALDWTRTGGGAKVLGIQEIPQENSAKADIQFNNFEYMADSVGSPVSKDKKVKPIPKDRLPTPEEYAEQLNRPREKSYSGSGVAILKHYNDGRWVLTEVHFNFDGIKTNIQIQ